MYETAHILVVDDEVPIREGLSDLLALEGHIVTTAQDGEEGAKLFDRSFARDDLPPFDVIILDIKMPRLGGLALLDIIRSRTTDIPVIMITGHGDTQTAKHALSSGAHDYISKPFEPELVLAAVARALAVSRLRRRLVHAEHMANIGSIARGIARELNAPLDTITQSAEALSIQLRQLSQHLHLSGRVETGSRTNSPNADIDLDPAFKHLETITRAALHGIRVLEALDRHPSGKPDTP